MTTTWSRALARRHSKGTVLKASNLPQSTRGFRFPRFRIEAKGTTVVKTTGKNPDSCITQSTQSERASYSGRDYSDIFRLVCVKHAASEKITIAFLVLGA